MRILQLGACALGKHKRDRKRVWHDGYDYRSWCRGCGKPMVSEMGGWVITTDSPTLRDKDQR